MSIEVEQKFSLTNRLALAEKIESHGATSQQTITQVDVYYAHPARDFAQTDEALRIRRVGDSSYITYKGPKFDATTKTRREIEMPLAKNAAEGCAEMLEALSFRPVATVTKVRQVYSLQYQGQTVEIALDRVEGVGEFAELEIVVDDRAEVADAQQAIAALAGDLQLEQSEVRSYLELLLENIKPN